MAKHLIALKAAINSNSLMCRPELVVVQGPPVLMLTLKVPHLEREASEHIKIEGEMRSVSALPRRMPSTSTSLGRFWLFAKEETELRGHPC